MRCEKCGKYLSALADHCSCTEMEAVTSEEVTAEPVTERFIIQIRRPLGESDVYQDWETLREAIVQGTVRKSMLARVVKESDLQKEEVEGASWQTIEAMTKTNDDLDALYHPIWATAKKYMLYGVIACVILKALDTTLMLFAAAPPVGILWLLTIGSLFVKKWWAPFAVIYISVKMGIAANLFMTAMAVGLVGAAFGVPLGLLVGTLVGYWKSRHSALARDAEDEGSRPWIYGLAVPSAALVALGWFYFIWLMPRLVEWMA